MKSKNLLKTIGFAHDPNYDLDRILKPATDELTTEIQKFINSLRVKFQINAVNQLYLINLSSEINHIDKKIQNNTGVPTAVFNPLTLTKKTSVTEPFLKDLPSFIAAIGGSLD